MNNRTCLPLTLILVVLFFSTGNLVTLAQENILLSDLRNLVSSEESDTVLSLTSPTGGESWKTGSSHTITWTSVNVELVNIEFSDNGGSTWSSVASNRPYAESYSWTVPDISSENCLIRITDVYNASVSDSSNTFSIVPPSVGGPLDILYLGNAVPPEEGDTIMPGLLEEMGFNVSYEALLPNSPASGYDLVVLSDVPGSAVSGWAHYGSVPLPIVSFKVHALKLEGLNWIASGDGVTAVDYDISRDSIVKVIDAAHPIMTGITDSEIQVANNVSDNLANVGWVHLTDIDGITVVGQSGTTDPYRQAIVAIEEGTVLNATNTTQNRAAILGFHQFMWDSLNDNGKTLIENAIYWAAGRSMDTVISLTNPKGGESWKIGSSHTITWTSENVDFVNIDFSDNGGSTWSSVVSNTLSDGSYLWTVPLKVSANCLIRITDVSNVAIPDSSNTFSIVPSSSGGTLDVLYLGSAVPPEDGDTIMPGLLEEMGFDVTYEALLPESPISGYDLVVLSETPGSSGGGWAHYSTAPLPIVSFKVHALKAPALNWIASGDGVTGTDYDLSPDSVVTVIDATHSIMAGIYDSEIQVAENVDGSFPNVGWVNLMDDIEGITLVGQSGTEDGTHQAIVAIEEGTVLNPAVTLQNRAAILAFHQLMWDNITDDGKRLIENAIYWAASGSGTNPDTLLYLIRPNGGEIWEAGTIHNITWSSAKVSNVSIDYSLDSGENWIIITDSTPSDGSYQWNVPNITSNTCLVRITSLDNETIQDESYTTFKILQTLDIIVTHPNGGEELTINENSSLQWTSENVSNVNISYSVNNGATWTSIEENYPSTGTYSWKVAGPVSNQAKLKISSSADEAIFDLSDAVFSIKEGTDGIHHDLINSKNVFCYPNPTTHSFQIKGFEGKATVRVFDLEGRLMLMKNITANEIIAADVLSPGVYIVKIATDKGLIEKKLLKE